MTKKLGTGLIAGALTLTVMGAGVSCSVPEEQTKPDNGVAEGIGSKDAADDVRLGEMQVDSFGGVTIPVTVKNPTSKTSDYMVEATILDGNGVNVGTAMTYISRVGPDSKAKNELIGMASGAENYKLSVVERTASSG